MGDGDGCGGGDGGGDVCGGDVGADVCGGDVGDVIGGVGKGTIDCQDRGSNGDVNYNSHNGSDSGSDGDGGCVNDDGVACLMLVFHMSIQYNLIHNISEYPQRLH